MKFRTLIGAASVAAVAGLIATSALAAERVLKIRTSSNASHAWLAYLNEVWVPKLEEKAGSKAGLELLSVDAVVPRRETPEAIGAGRPDGDLTAFNDIPGVDPAFALMGDLIAGHDGADQLKACRARGGKEMLRKLMDAPSPGVHLAACIRLCQHVDRLDRKLVARDKAKGDLTIIDWTQSERDKFRQVAKGAREDFAREVSESHARSMKHAGLL